MPVEYKRARNNTKIHIGIVFHKVIHMRETFLIEKCYKHMEKQSEDAE